MRYLICGLALVDASAMTVCAQPPAAWVTIRGQVMLPVKAAIPERKKLDVTADKAHCLSKGPILDESALVNPKTRGIKNVVVWLRPDNKDLTAKFAANEIHPGDAKRKPVDVVIDQPCCMFVPRVTTCRVGDTIVAKNSAPITHNFFWSSANNGEINVAIGAKNQHRFEKPLVAEASGMSFRCTIHPWMSGWVRVFDHPYYAITDENGNFEIKNAPAGKYRIMYWRGETGFKDGAAGRFGEPLTVSAGKDGAMEMKAIDFDVAK